jgi:FAD/FMN-containing dehydrogenase
MSTFMAAAALPLVTATDPGWDEARRAWNLAVDQRPAAVARPRSAEEVVATIAFARRQGLPIAAQGTGHNAAPLGPLDGTVVVRTDAMRQVAIHPAAMTAPVEAGVLWHEVVAVGPGGRSGGRVRGQGRAVGHGPLGRGPDVPELRGYRRDPRSFWTVAAYDRLRRIKAAVDPDDIIRANHPIPVA